MIDVAAIREKVWFDKITDRALYQQTCAAYGVSFRLYRSHKDIPITERQVIVFEENGSIPLEEFVHPEDAIYIFGRTGYDVRNWFPDAISVKIVTPGRSSLFGCVACGIVLEDRKRKQEKG